MKAIHHILTHCGGLKPKEKALIICDETTSAIGQAFWTEAHRLGAVTDCHHILRAKDHGIEPPQAVAKAMQWADLTICLTAMSLAHTHARKNSKCRFLSLPGYDWNLLHNPCVMVDYEAQAAECKRIADAFTNGKELRVTSPKGLGTDITVSIEGRIGNACPGFVRNPGDLGSPPDIEANIAPIEGTAVGFIEASSPEVGMFIERGRAEGIWNDPKHSLLAEVGVGLNPLAKICGNMLIDEGAIGTVHFGFGSNHTIGGQNDTDFHCDYVVADATIYVDGVKL